MLFDNNSYVFIRIIGVKTFNFLGQIYHLKKNPAIYKDFLHIYQISYTKFNNYSVICNRYPSRISFMVLG